MFLDNEWDLLTTLFKFIFDCTEKGGDKASGEMNW